jgi:hypothetical protein
MVAIDSTPNNIWQIGKPQKLIFDSAATLPNVIVTDTINNYPINNLSSFIIKCDSWTNYGIMALRWMQKVDIDTNDGGKIEFSVDSGTTWVNAFNSPYVYNLIGFNNFKKDTLPGNNIYFSGKDTTWKDMWLCFSMAWLTSVTNEIQFKFTFKSDSLNTPHEGWMIDNIWKQINISHPLKAVDEITKGKVFPNPTNGKIQIQLPSINSFYIIEKMSLINMQGAVLDTWKNIPTKFYIETEKYPKGNYILRIKTNLKTETFKIKIE